MESTMVKLRKYEKNKRKIESAKVKSTMMKSLKNDDEK